MHWMLRQYKVVLPALCFLGVLILSCGIVRPAFAYFSEVQILEQKDISALSDEALKDAYVNVLIELKAITAFHQTSGFHPQEYRQFKEIWRFCYNLKTELQKRKLEIPQLDP